IGEGEEMVPEFIEHWDATRGSPNQLRELAAVQGAYLPDFYTPVYDDAGLLAAVNYSGPGTAQVNRRLIRDLNRFTTSSLILTEESVFGDMFLVEASRGCQWGCRFCAAGFMYRPIRYRAPETLIAEAERGLGERKVIGLVGAEMASVPGVADVASAVVAEGRLHFAGARIGAGARWKSERDSRAGGRQRADAQGHQQESYRGRDSGRGRYDAGRGRRQPEILFHDRLARGARRRRARDRRPGRQGARTRPRAPHPHRLRDRVAQSVCAQAVDAVSMGSDAGRAIDQAQGRDAAPAPHAAGTSRA